MEGLSFRVVVTMAAIFLFSYYSSAHVQTFLQCLSNHDSTPLFPISEAIYTPNNSSQAFQSILLSYTKNLRFATPQTPKPLAIVTALHESHVQATVVCAKANDLQIRIRSGGHDIEGLSYVSSVPFAILDLFNLRSIQIDPVKKTAWVQAGATLGELYHKIDNTSKELAYPGGVCPTVGVGGHITGGGYGNMLRNFGLTIDNVIDATLVDVNGKILNRKSMGEDLFWALRGGGGGNFGVILSWKIKLVSIPPKVTVFKVNRTIEEGGTDVFLQWQKMAPQLPKELFIRSMPVVTKRKGDQNQKTVAIIFYAMFLGKPDQLFSLVTKSISKLGLEREDCLEMSWAESIVFWADFPLGTSIDVLIARPSSTTQYSKGKSDFLKSPIRKKDVVKIWKKMMKMENFNMQWNPYGGVMDEISESETPFPHRKGNIFEIQYNIVWKEERKEKEKEYLKEIREFYDEMGEFVSSGPREAFVNYRDIDIGSNPSNETFLREAQIYGSKYFKDNLSRLMKVKSEIDPDNFFRNEQSIPPHFIRPLRYSPGRGVY